LQAVVPKEVTVRRAPRPIRTRGARAPRARRRADAAGCIIEGTDFYIWEESREEALAQALDLVDPACRGDLRALLGHRPRTVSWGSGTPLTIEALVAAVSDASASSREVVAVLDRLFRSGRVRLARVGLRGRPPGPVGHPATARHGTGRQTPR
jgi:hypothetical protein